MQLNFAVLRDVAFWLFVMSWGLDAFLLSRFVRRLSQKQSSYLAEKLSLLLISGSGRISDEWRALQYVIQRKYSSLNDKEMIKLGDQARVCFFLSCGLMLTYVVLALITQSM